MYVEKVKDWKFLVTPSPESKRRKRYSIIKRKDESYSCDCKSFRYGTDECKHIQAVKTWLEEHKELTIEVFIPSLSSDYWSQAYQSIEDLKNSCKQIQKWLFVDDDGWIYRVKELM